MRVCDVGIEESLSQLQWMDETTYEVYRVRTKDGTGSLAACKRARENQLFGVSRSTVCRVA